MSSQIEIVKFYVNSAAVMVAGAPAVAPCPPPLAPAPPLGPSLLDFLELLHDLNHDESTLRCLDCARALRRTCRAVRNFVDATAPLPARCPGGEVQAFCAPSHHRWAETLQHIVLGALYGVNADAVDVSAFAALPLPALRSLRVKSLQLRYAWRLAEGSWPRLTSLSLSLRDSGQGRITLCAFGGAGAFSRACWPLQELTLRLEGPRFMPAELEAAVAAGVATAFAPTLRHLNVVGTVAGGDVLAALKELGGVEGKVVWEVVDFWRLRRRR
jgi:hypothetical protein